MAAEFGIDDRFAVIRIMNPRKNNGLDFSASLEMTIGVGSAVKHGLKTK